MHKRRVSMTRKNPAGIRRAIFATLVVGAIVFGVMALAVSPTPAAPSGNCTYYSDASHTTVVGKFGKDCCNNTVAWGVKTQFSVCGGCFVCFPPPR
jgi:Family of unknown function (DUF6289)